MPQIIEFIGKHLLLCGAFVAVAAALAYNLFAGSLGRGRPVGVGEAVRLINREKAVVVDVRPRDQYETGHILNAEHIPVAEAGEAPKRLEKYKSRPVLLVCGNGMQAPAMAAALVTAGFEQVYRLRGGLTDWQTENMPLATK